MTTKLCRIIFIFFAACLPIKVFATGSEIKSDIIPDLKVNVPENSGLFDDAGVLGNAGVLRAASVLRDAGMLMDNGALRYAGEFRDAGSFAPFNFTISNNRSPVL